MSTSRPGRIHLLILGLAGLFASHCSDRGVLFPYTSYEQGTICIYTARGYEQFGPEIDEFLKVHKNIELRCPGIGDAPLPGTKGRRDSIWCPKRIEYQIESDRLKKQCIERDTWAVCYDAGKCTCQGEPWEILRESTVTLTDRLEAERVESPDGASVAGDVVWGLAASHLITIDEMLRPYAPKGWSAILEQANAGSERKRAIWADFVDTRSDVPRWVGIDVFMVALCVNPQKLQKRRVARGLPASWMEYSQFGEEGVRVRILPRWDLLLDADLDGMLAMPHPQRSGTGFSFLGGMAAKATDYEEFFAVLDKNVYAYTSSGSGPCDLVLEDGSDVAIGLTYDGYAVTTYSGDPLTGVKGKSDVIDVWWPPEGDGFYDIGANALIEKPKVAAAAQTFLDWASEDAMATYKRTVMVTAIEDDAETPGAYPAYEDFLQLLSSDMDVFRVADNREAWQYEWGCRICNLDQAQGCAESPGGASARRCDGGECSEDHKELWPDFCADDTSEDACKEAAESTSTSGSMSSETSESTSSEMSMTDSSGA